MKTDSRARLQVLKKLLGQGLLSTQDELREELERQEFQVTQSTISRDLRKIGAIKAIDPQGRTVYRLGDGPSMTVHSKTLSDLVTAIMANPSMIVIHTLPGSASLIARRLDLIKPAGILGTIAGDDTIFVAPAAVKKIPSTIEAIQNCLETGP
jgi:transcriptional regulator of arginine metabolism